MYCKVYLLQIRYLLCYETEIMKQLRLFGLIIICICFFIHCSSSPVKTWKSNFDKVIKKISSIPVTKTGDPADFRKFYTYSDELYPLTKDSEYALDLLKDLLLTSEYLTVRSAAAMTLGRIGKREDAYTLINALNDTSPFAKNKVYKALKGLTREDFGTDKDKWIEWWNKKEAENDD